MEKDCTQQKIGDETSFEELLQESEVGRYRFSKGQKIEAPIVGITSEWIFIDLGGKSEGVLAREECIDDSGELTVKEGDAISAYFIATRNNEIIFTTRIDGSDAGKAYLEDAWQGGVPVEGVIEKERKGGFDVKIAGGVRAFCPYSQLGLTEENSADVIGKKVVFKIIEYGEKGKNIVVSHRVIVEEEREKKREELRKTLTPGIVVRGKVVSLREFGAFVDIGGVQGLVPISEIGWERIDAVADVLSVGQEIDVVISRLDWEKNRISLSIKETLADPWERVIEKYPKGSRHKGKVVRLTKFGAFVELEGGVDGLIHISKLGGGRRINHPKEVMETGQTIEVEVESVDADQRRIALDPADYADSRREEAEQDLSRYMGESGGSMGTLGHFLKRKIERKKKG